MLDSMYACNENMKTIVMSYCICMRNELSVMFNLHKCLYALLLYIIILYAIEASYFCYLQLFFVVGYSIKSLALYVMVLFIYYFMNPIMLNCYIYYNSEVKLVCW